MSESKKFFRFIDTDNKIIFYIVAESMSVAIDELASLDLEECKHIVGRELDESDARKVTVTDEGKSIELCDAEMRAVFSNMV
jgi:hypothetical protein